MDRKLTDNSIRMRGICTKEQLRDYLAYEEKVYFSTKKEKLEYMLEREPQYYIWRYTRLLRKVEYHHNNSGMIHKILYAFWRRRKNCLGNRLGIEIWDNTFDKGLMIFHAGNIVINGMSQIGKNCKLHGSNCIGNNGITLDAPILGDNIDVGVGAKIIGGVRLADNIKIGAGAVVVNSFEEEGCTLVGIPARKVKQNEMKERNNRGE